MGIARAFDAMLRREANMHAVGVIGLRLFKLPFLFGDDPVLSKRKSEAPEMPQDWDGRVADDV